ncbi:hypothetical protein JRC04_24880 [Mycolicibacterium sp. S2-37]|uniref:hypothetical protein n=1 Tax=Mycolicibacterium sp. S2-37 TaxID=2810297 RepID=UPI001A93F84C|nr:hypothetical protein [Mycolicibacterium sp. S2-37]MBO0680713.1 hypothetical protein [Mycolicibacterium sp. S2-37]
MSRLVRSSDPRIRPGFFGPDGGLLSPSKVGGAQWSLYDAQLSNYLAAYPNLTAAIADFGVTYNRIANASPPAGS